mmetsp:Transcript_5371/g.22149  ORF Transcript_5371/g.22149 Transcript_5371/m.22149 type:complete len:218 (+) Transcript_5371:1-654(+)
MSRPTVLATFLGCLRRAGGPGEDRDDGDTEEALTSRSGAAMSRMTCAQAIAAINEVLFLTRDVVTMWKMWPGWRLDGELGRPRHPPDSGVHKRQTVKWHFDAVAAGPRSTGARELLFRLPLSASAGTASSSHTQTEGLTDRPTQASTTWGVGSVSATCPKSRQAAISLSRGTSSRARSLPGTRRPVPASDSAWVRVPCRPLAKASRLRSRRASRTTP